MYGTAPKNDFGNYVTNYSGYHPGEDWHLIGGERRYGRLWKSPVFIYRKEQF